MATIKTILCHITWCNHLIDEDTLQLNQLKRIDALTSRAHKCFHSIERIGVDTFHDNIFGHMSIKKK